MQKSDLSFLQSELTRVSDWIQFSDKKASFLGVFYSGAFALLVSERKAVLYNLLTLDCGILSLYIFVITATIVVFLIGIFFLAKSFFPTTKDFSKKASLCYYGSISTFSLEDFVDRFTAVTDEEVRRDLLRQIHTNSTIATRKMVEIQNSTKSLLALVSLLFILLFGF